MTSIASPALQLNRAASRTKPGLVSQARLVLATRFDPATTLISWAICVTILMTFLVICPDCRHWYILPVLLCGVVITHDVVDWFRGRFDVFDPIGMIGLFGFHWFFFEPLLQVYWDWWLIDPQIRAANPRDWLGWIGLLYFGGLLIYRYLRNPLTGQLNLTNRKVWVLEPTRFWLTLGVFMVVSVVLQGIIYAMRGGIAGYMQAFASGAQAFGQDIGMVAVFAEAFPILAMMAYVVLARRNPILTKWPVLCVALVGLFVLLLLFGGLKGSRQNTMFQLFWAVGMIHFCIRPVSKKVILIGVVFLFGFLYLYAFYKSAGLRAISAVESGADLDYLERRTGRRLDGLILAELSRTELQSFVLYQLFNKDFEYDLALGRTYYATLCRFIPAFVWPNRPLLKDFEGTEIQYGKGSYDPRYRFTSYVFGSVAEGMLNFGVAAVPFVFLIWTLLVARIRKWIYSWDRADVRLFMAGFLVNLCIMFFFLDSEIVAFALVKFAALPLLMLWFGSRHMPRFVRRAVPLQRMTLPSGGAPSPA